MRIYFENYEYDPNQIKPYLDDKLLTDSSNKNTYTDYIGYLFVSNDKYSGPVFILPKSFLIQEGNKLNVLGNSNVYPENVIDTDDDKNPLAPSENDYLLPRLGIWLYRALNRFREEHQNSLISEQAQLDSQLPEDWLKDKDFLSTALDLIDFLKDHRNLFTQISLINHSGKNKIDWHKTISGNSFIQDDEAWYLNPATKVKAINIDDTLLVLYYSVLKYLRDNYCFPVDLGEVPYELLSVSEVQRLIDTGVGNKLMKRIRYKYFRDDLKQLWKMLDSFFAFNDSNEDKNRMEEHLLVRNFQTVFEVMIDSLISDTDGVEDLKKQDDGKLVDHIFKFTSLIGNFSEIYYIGDSKYYRDDLRPTGIAWYKQFTYAKNAIQYNIDRDLYHKKRKGLEAIRYRDSITEGYNVTPNFFIRSRVTKSDLDLSKHSLRDWAKENGLENPTPNKHFEDRLFDRDTLILREFSINLLFVIAAYANYEDTYWSLELHRIIRDTFIESINEYFFYIITPTNRDNLGFFRLYFHLLNGKAYTIDEQDNCLIVAFEKNTTKGRDDKKAFMEECLKIIETGETIEYTCTGPYSLQELNEQLKASTLHTLSDHEHRL